MPGPERGVATDVLEPGPPRTEQQRRWDELARWSHVLDSSLRIPGTKVRVGWDGIMGFVPVIGDGAGLALALAVVAKGVHVGARGWTLARLIGVALLDAAIGLVPFLGAVADLAFKGNERNLRTLQRHAVASAEVEAESRRLVLTGAAVAAVVGSAVAAAVALLVVLVLRALGW